MTGCGTTTEFVEIAPVCEPEPRPELVTDRGKLWDALDGGPLYESVEDDIDALITWGLGNEAVISAVCDDP